eukprot:832978-Rhodomonas_salina.3
MEQFRGFSVEVHRLLPNPALEFLRVLLFRFPIFPDFLAVNPLLAEVLGKDHVKVHDHVLLPETVPLIQDVDERAVSNVPDRHQLRSSPPDQHLQRPKEQRA